MTTAFGFGVARAALGVGEGGNFPSAIKAVALWFPKKERALATSIFNSGTNVGAIIAPALVPWIALTWGWQAAFIAAGIAGFVWLFAWIPLYNVPETAQGARRGGTGPHRERPRRGPTATAKIPWLKLLGYRQTWSFIMAQVPHGPGVVVLPDLAARLLQADARPRHQEELDPPGDDLHHHHGAQHRRRLADRATSRSRGWSITRARKTGMFIFALCVMPIYFTTAVGEWMAVLLIGIAGAAHQAWSANLFTTASDMFPKRAVASVTGIGGMAGALGGAMFPTITGMLLDSFKASGNVTAGYAVLFSFCAFIYLVAFAVNHCPRAEVRTLRDEVARASSL